MLLFKSIQILERRNYEDNIPPYFNILVTCTLKKSLLYYIVIWTFLLLFAATWKFASYLSQPKREEQDFGFREKNDYSRKGRSLCYTQQNQKTHTSNILVAKHIRHTRYNHKFFGWGSECIKYCCSTSLRKEVTCRGEEAPRIVVAHNTSHKLS